MYTTRQREQALELYRSGNSLRTCAETVGCAHGTVRNWLRSEGEKPRSHSESGRLIWQKKKTAPERQFRKRQTK